MVADYKEQFLAVASGLKPRLQHTYVISYGVATKVKHY